MISQSLFTFPVMIPTLVRQQANAIAQSFSDQQRADQVYAQQVARYAVKYYLKGLGYEIAATDGGLVETFLNQALLDTAILHVAGYGSLTCHVLSEGIEEIEVPLDVKNDRIGHIFVEFNQGDREAVVVGFVNAVAKGNIAVRSLRSLTELPAYLESLPPRWETVMTDLGDWVTGMFDASWQALSDVFTPSHLQLATRMRRADVASRCKVIDLDNGQSSVVSVIAICDQPDETKEVMVELIPGNSGQYLPDSLRMSVLSDGESPLADFHPQPNTQNFQFELGCEPGDSFQIRLDTETTTIIENFLI
ncbi:MAG: DUF1822 family protein [Cyanobacteria bacterium J06642_11]